MHVQEAILGSMVISNVIELGSWLHRTPVFQREIDGGVGVEACVFGFQLLLDHDHKLTYGHDFRNEELLAGNLRDGGPLVMRNFADHGDLVGMFLKNLLAV